MHFTIAVIPGDGIGPEIIEQAILVLKKIGEIFSHEFTFREVLAGGCAIDALGIPLPEESLTICKNSDSILLGAIGGPKWDHLEVAKRPEKALLRLRQELELYANIRPVFLYEALKDACPLKPDIVAGGINICVVRELTGGIYFGARGRKKRERGIEAYDTECYSEREIVRIAKVAFEMALSRQKKVTSVDKANILESSRLWRSVVTKVAQYYPEVKLKHMYVDNAAMQLLRAPKQFDVILTTNMFGDILSDEASMITGSIGMLPSASLGKTKLGMYEPVHGSAPDISGKDKANPIAAILSAAMMLRLSFDLEKEAGAVEKAVSEVLNNNYRTPDIISPGKKLVGTEKMGELIRGRIDQHKGSGKNEDSYPN
ncbi:MAG: 3-isopropylmalate dehydrogenase [Candidatus Aminicenantales bacterium]